MTELAANITNATAAYLDALKARSWDNPNWSPSYQAQRRAGVLAPLRQRVEALTAQARANHDKAAGLLDVAGIIDAQDDPQRLIARELAWQRLAPAVESGDASTVADLAAGASALELEALHVGLTSLAATPSLDGGQYTQMLETVADAYPRSAGAPAALAEAAEAAQQLEADVPVAQVADDIIAGKSYLEIGGEKLSNLLGTDTDEGNVLYGLVADDGFDAIMAQAKADDAQPYDGKPEAH